VFKKGTLGDLRHQVAALSVVGDVMEILFCNYLTKVSDMLSTWLRKCWYTIPYHTSPLEPYRAALYWTISVLIDATNR